MAVEGPTDTANFTTRRTPHTVNLQPHNLGRMPWKRPAHVPLGQVWRRFQGRPRADGSRQKYQIRDVLETDADRCMHLLTDTFMRDEPLGLALGIPSDNTSLVTIHNDWRKDLEHQVSLACYVENEDGEPGELVAFNICLVKRQDDPEVDLDQVQGDTWRNLLKTLILIKKMCNVFQKYGIDQYLTSSGLIVLPDHRGQNIGAEMYKAREPLCRALGLQATASVFSAKTSQVLAAKCGYELLGELQYDTMLLHGIDIKECDTPSAKYMGMKFY